MLYRLSDDVTSVLGVAGSGVSLLDDGILTFVIATSTNVEQVERLQDRFNEGPCKDASATAAIVNDLHAHTDRCPSSRAAPNCNTPWTAASSSSRPRAWSPTHHDVDMSTAFEVLRSHARNTNRRLHDVAADTVNGALRI